MAKKALPRLETVSRGPFHRILDCPKRGFRGEHEQCDDSSWARIRDGYDPANVFLNIPYTTEYAPLAHLLVAFLVERGLCPKLASDTELNDARLCKICEHMQMSSTCISDLTYVGRHNIPTEVGLAYGLARQHVILFAGEEHALQERLSDLNSLAANVHHYQEGNLKSLARRLLVMARKSIPLREIAKYATATTRREMDDHLQFILDLQAIVKEAYDEYDDYDLVVREILSGIRRPEWQEARALGRGR